MRLLSALVVLLLLAGCGSRAKPAHECVVTPNDLVECNEKG